MDAEEKPLLTYCLVTYNQEKYVRESVLSAFAQTYSPLEIVLSDDCSTDRTFEIMRELAAGYRGPHRIILNRNERNLGLGMHASKVWGELSSGRWLIGAAGDDISLPERAEAVARAAQQYPEAACIWSGCDFIDGEGAPQWSGPKRRTTSQKAGSPPAAAAPSTDAKQHNCRPASRKNHNPFLPTMS